MQNNTSLRRYFLLALVPGALILASIIVQIFSMEEWLRYDREAILSGQIWRVLTGHWVHLGWSHLWLNLLGLILVWLLFGGVLTTGYWLLHGAIISFFITFGLLCWNPEIGWYVGLSGILHGFFALGLIRSSDKQLGFSLGVAIIFVVKLVWEQFYGPLPGSEQSAGGPVLVDAHFYGAIGACFSCFLLGTIKAFAVKTGVYKQ